MIACAPFIISAHVVVVVVGVRRHLGVDIGMRTMKVLKKLMMNSNDNLGRVCDDDGKYSEDDSYDDSDETLKLDEGVLHMREEGDGEDVNDLQDSMGSSAVQGASAEVIDVNILIKSIMDTVLRLLMSLY